MFNNSNNTDKVKLFLFCVILFWGHGGCSGSDPYPDDGEYLIKFSHYICKRQAKSKTKSDASLRSPLFKSMETKINGFIKAMLREFYKDEGMICLGCMFYYRHMKRYDAPAIIKAYGLWDEEYSYGQKACIKNKNFTYFNSTCMSFTKTPGTQYAQAHTFKGY